MLLGYQYYQFTGEKFINEIKKYVKARNKVKRAARAFSKKHGGDGRYIASRSETHRVMGITFPKGHVVDRDMWMKVEAEVRAWRPKNLKKSRELFEEFTNLPTASLNGLEELAEYAPITGGFSIHFFCPFWNEDITFAGHRVPIVSDKEARVYKAPQGMKKISISEYRRWMGKEEE